MKTNRCIPVWTVLSIVSTGLAMAGDKPLLITNKDLPRTPKVSVIGTLSVAQAQADTEWIERIDAMVSELEAGRQQPPAERSEPPRAPNRDYCSVGAAPLVARVGLPCTCLFGSCPTSGWQYCVRPGFGRKKQTTPGGQTTRPHLVDALPDPPDGFAGRRGKHLERAD